MATNRLPPIKTLFSDSWKVLKASVVRLLILQVISFALFFALFIVGLIIAAPLGLFSVFSAVQDNGVSPAFFASLGVLGVVILVLIILAIVIGTMTQAAMVMIVADYKSKPSYGAVLKKGLSLVWPLTLAGTLTGFITTGGLFLFIIPGILFGLAFMFVSMEIILNKQGVISAVKRSMGIVFSNFWGILVRILIFFIVAIIVSAVPQALAGGSDNAGVALFSFLSMIVNILVGWYGIAFSITLYHQASKNYTGKGAKLLWPVIVAVAGWIVGIIFMTLIIGAVAYFINGAVMKKGANQAQYNKELQMILQNPSEESLRKVIELLPTGSPERAELNRQMMEYNKSISY